MLSDFQEKKAKCKSVYIDHYLLCEKEREMQKQFCLSAYLCKKKYKNDKLKSNKIGYLQGVEGMR